jgi:tetratricopeptide (TPR) repeat protein
MMHGRSWLVAWPLLLVQVAAAELSRSSPLPLSADLSPGASPQKDTSFSRGLQALQARDYEEALVQFENAASSARIDTMPLSWLSAQDQVCQTLNLLGRRAEAIERARRVAVQCEAALGAEDPITSEALSHLAFLLKKDGRLSEAEPVYNRNLAGLVDKHGEDSFFAAQARTRLANLLMLLGRMDEAETQHRKAVAAAQTALGEGHDGNCFFLTHLAYCLHVSHKKPEATTLMEKAFGILRDNAPQDVSHLGSILRRQAEFFLETKQMDKARLAGRLCFTRLASKDQATPARFFYYDKVRELYHSILVADGLKPHEIQTHLSEMETSAQRAH